MMHCAIYKMWACYCTLYVMASIYYIPFLNYRFFLSLCKHLIQCWDLCKITIQEQKVKNFKSMICFLLLQPAATAYTIYTDVIYCSYGLHNNVTYIINIRVSSKMMDYYSV